jgi:hypothetical protein
MIDELPLLAGGAMRGSFDLAIVTYNLDTAGLPTLPWRKHGCTEYLAGNSG